MLGSADPEHIDSSDRSAAYKDWWQLCKSWETAYVEFYLNSMYLLMIVDISLYAKWKST